MTQRSRPSDLETKRISRRVSVWYTQQTHTLGYSSSFSKCRCVCEPDTTNLVFFLLLLLTVFISCSLFKLCVCGERENSFFQCCCCCCVWSQRKKVWPRTDGRRRHNMKMVFFFPLLFLTLIFFWEEQNIQEIKKNSGKKRFHLSDPKREREGGFIPQEENSLALSKTLWVFKWRQSQIIKKIKKKGFSHSSGSH